MLEQIQLVCIYVYFIGNSIKLLYIITPNKYTLYNITQVEQHTAHMGLLVAVDSPYFNCFPLNNTSFISL